MQCKACPASPVMCSALPRQVAGKRKLGEGFWWLRVRPEEWLWALLAGPSEFDVALAQEFGVALWGH